MTPSSHHRRSIRLAGYDYSQSGAYFVTICTNGRACLFGKVVDGKIRLNEAGIAICDWWRELENKYPVMETDAMVIMPSHLHGIIIIHEANANSTVAPNPNLISPSSVGADLRVRPLIGQDRGVHIGAPLQTNSTTGDVRPTIGDIVQWFKTMTTNEYIRGVKAHGWSPFHGRLWQRNYYEHVVRNEDELNRIRDYIEMNPMRWANDRDNPNATDKESETPWRI